MRTNTERGSALLAVLWLSAALAAIAFSVAATVRGETERASTTVDGVRAYYIATGAIDRSILWMFWNFTLNPRNPDGTPMYWAPPMSRLVQNFPGGVATVEVIPEGGKLNVNTASPGDIATLLTALGLDSGLASRITAGILNWRGTGGGGGGPMPNFGFGSTFQPRHASLEELEELLLVPGMTPDIFYGRYDHDPSGRLIPRGGLRDCLTVWGNGSKVDVNTAPPALLQSLGLSPEVVRNLIARRTTAPFLKMEDVEPFVPDGGIRARLSLGGNSIYTLRAVARVRTPNGQSSDLRKTVGAVVKFLDSSKWDPPYHILRWYDDAWSPAVQAN